MVGQLVYHLSGRKVLKYPEEKAGFVVPAKYLVDRHAPNRPSPHPVPGDVTEPREMAFQRPEAGDGATATPASSSERVEEEEEGKVIVVDWYGDDDPENPQNWYVQTRSTQVASLRTRWEQATDAHTQVIGQEVLAGLLHHAHHDLGLYRVVDILAGDHERRRVLRRQHYRQYIGPVAVWCVLFLLPHPTSRPVSLDLRTNNRSGRLRHWPAFPGAHHRDPPDRTKLAIHRPSRHLLRAPSTYRARRKFCRVLHLALHCRFREFSVQLDHTSTPEIVRRRSKVIVIIVLTSSLRRYRAHPSRQAVRACLTSSPRRRSHTRWAYTTSHVPLVRHWALSSLDSRSRLTAGGGHSGRCCGLPASHWLC